MTATDVALELFSHIATHSGQHLRRVDCGHGDQIASGTTLACRMTFPDGQTLAFHVTVTGTPGGWYFEVGNLIRP